MVIDVSWFHSDRHCLGNISQGEAPPDFIFHRVGDVKFVKNSILKIPTNLGDKVKFQCCQFMPVGSSIPNYPKFELISVLVT